MFTYYGLWSCWHSGALQCSHAAWKETGVVVTMLGKLYRFPVTWSGSVMSVCYVVQEVRNTVDGEVCVTCVVVTVLGKLYRFPVTWSGSVMSVCYVVQEVRNTVNGEVCVTIAVRYGAGLLSSGCRTAFFVGTLGDPAASSHAHSEPVWPSGKACKQRDLSSNPLRLSFLFKRL